MGRLAIVGMVLLVGIASLSVSAKTSSHKKSGEVCQCTCYKNGEITRSWQADPDSAPSSQNSSSYSSSSKVSNKSNDGYEGGYPAEDNSSYKSEKAGNGYSSAPAPSYEPKSKTKSAAKKSTDSSSSSPAESSYKKTKYSGASSYNPSTTQESSSAKSSKKHAREEEPSDNRGSAAVSGLSDKVRIGDGEDKVRHSLGEPYIATTTASGESLWIYTQKKSVHGNPCDLVKWKLTFKGGKLKEMAQPRDEIYVGYCGK